jgi:hypothetical protein
MHKKMAFLYRKPSYLKAIQFLTNYFSKSNSVEIINIDKTNPQIFLNYDIVFLGLGGLDTNNIINFFDVYDKKPKTISLFPGIVGEEQLDAFITRVRCDLVLLNSKKNEAVHKKVCKIFNRPYNGFLFGASWYCPSLIKKSSDSKKLIVFFEQIDAPSSRKERSLLVKNLLLFAENNFSFNILIKPRKEFIGNEKSIVPMLSNCDIPNNLTIVDQEIGDLINIMDFGITVSSSVAIEALLENKKIVIINDFKPIYTKFYNGSGLFRRILEIEPHNLPNVNKTWLEDNLTNPKDRVNLLSEKIKSLSDYKLQNDFSMIQLRLFYHFFPIYIKKIIKTRKLVRNALRIITIKKTT